jgi:hypothetical protein
VRKNAASLVPSLEPGSSHGRSRRAHGIIRKAYKVENRIFMRKSKAKNAVPAQQPELIGVCTGAAKLGRRFNEQNFRILTLDKCRSADSARIC